MNKKIFHTTNEATNYSRDMIAERENIVNVHTHHKPSSTTSRGGGALNRM